MATNNVEQFIFVGETAMPIDTEEQLALAQAALKEEGQESAKVWYGHPDSPDSYASRTIVLRAAE